jgi:hypothetical protein
LPCVFCHSASRRCISSLETVNVFRTALTKRSTSVLPWTGGAGTRLADAEESKAYYTAPILSPA